MAEEGTQFWSYTADEVEACGQKNPKSLEQKVTRWNSQFALVW